MKEDQLSALETLARAATPWTSEDCCAMFDPSPNGPDQYRVGPNVYDCQIYINGTGEIPPQASRDERFVAHANPTVILEMIAHARLQEERIGRLRDALTLVKERGNFGECACCGWDSEASYAVDEALAKGVGG